VNNVTVTEDVGSVTLQVTLNTTLVGDEFIELSVMLVNSSASEFPFQGRRGL